MKISAMSGLLAASAAMWLLASPALAGGGPFRVFVRADAPSGGDGQSWATAFNDFQDALDLFDAKKADEGAGFPEIWLARGTYTPTSLATPGNDRSATFDIPFGVIVYGGFWGDEPESGPVPLITERRYASILTGDLLGDDGGRGKTPFDDNAFHVVTVNDASCVIDGVQIRAGRASGGPQLNGGGVYITGFVPDVTFRNCQILENFAVEDGAGVYAAGGLLRIESCLFQDNFSTTGDGAGLYSGANGLVVVNSAFVGNSAVGGNSQGGGVFCGGPFNTISNSTFVRNNSTNGAGGVQAFAPSLVVRNSILWKNTGGDTSDELQQVNGNFVAVSTSCVFGLGSSYGGNGNIGLDPMLVPLSPGNDEDWDTFDDISGHVILPGSPCANAGANSIDTDELNPGVQPLPPTDLRGLTRIIDCNDAMPPDTVDMGATEVQAGEPVYWIQPGDGSWYTPSYWIGGVPAGGCTSARFESLYDFLFGQVFIPGKTLVAPTGIQVRNADIVIDMGFLSGLDLTGAFAGADGHIRVESGTLQIQFLGGGQEFVQTETLVVGDEHSANFFLDQIQLVADRAVVGGFSGSISLTGSTLTVGETLDVGRRAGESGFVFINPGDGVGVSGLTTIGGRGTGTIDVEGGNLDAFGGTIIGDEPTGVGVLGVGTYEGTSSFSAGMTDVIVGNQGYGNWFLSEANASAANLHIGAMPGGTGVVDVGPGTVLSLSGNIFVGAEDGGTGQLFFHSPDFLGALVTAVAPGSMVTGDGVLTSDLINRGVVSPDLGDQYPGSDLVVTGLYLQERLPGASAANSGSLIIDVAEFKGDPQTDRLFAGTAVLGGGLFLRPFDGFNPTPGVFEASIVQAASVVNTFDVVFTPVLSDGRFLRVRYEDGNSVRIYVDMVHDVAGYDEGEQIDVEPGASASSAAVGFFNGDEFLDLAVALPSDDSQVPGCVLILLNQGNAGDEWQGYTVAQCVTVGLDPSSVATGDVNGDGFADVVATNRLGDSVTILRNDGMGDFTMFLPVTLPVNDGPVDLAVADLNADFINDIVTVDQDAGGVSILLGLGGGVFAPADFEPTGELPTAVSVEEFTAAPGLEIAVTNKGDGTITVIENAGLFALRTSSNVPTGDGSLPDDIDSGDVDGDKDIDIVAADQSAGQSPTGVGGSVAVLRRDTSSSTGFAAPVHVPVGSDPTSVALTDTDRDGDLDIAVVADETGRGDGEEVLQIVRNDLVPMDGQLVFAEPVDVPQENDPTFVLPADVNNDNLDDLITLNTIAVEALRGVSTSQINVLLNAHEPPTVGDVDGDGMASMADLALILANFNLAGVGIPGDLDNDDFCGFSDLNLLLGNFNGGGG